MLQAHALRRLRDVPPRCSLRTTVCPLSQNFVFAQIRPVVNFPSFRIVDVLLVDQGGGISMITGALDHGRSHNAITGIANLLVDAVVNRSTDRMWLLSEG